MLGNRIMVILSVEFRNEIFWVFKLEVLKMAISWNWRTFEVEEKG